MHFTESSKSQNADKTLVEVSSGNTGTTAYPEPSASSFTPSSLNPTFSNQALPTAISKDEDFYYDCRIFQVENCLFRFPIQFLAAQSLYFQNLKDKTTNGFKEENPIDLNGVSREDFRQLLKILCSPRNFNTHPGALSLSQWEAVLRLSKRWGMDQTKMHAVVAIERLSDVDPVEKIVLARTYNIQSWLAPAFNDILQRSQSLTESDVEKLGIPTAVSLISLRDRLCPSVSEKGTWTLSSERIETNVDFTSLVWDAFPDSRSMATREKTKRTSLIVAMTRDSPAFSTTIDLLFEMIRDWSTRIERHTKSYARLPVPSRITRIDSHHLRLTFNEFRVEAFLSTWNAYHAEIWSFKHLSIHRDTSG
ncbi:hypothetical protein F5880DRAFT_1507122 [Lentinula raphanica]|nr:hypothetical protein F5880DRAFT_1507122 [Lentinula raphanica]